MARAALSTAGGATVVFVYFVTANVNYAVMILPDHDSEATVANAETSDAKGSCWLTQQIVHSGNFANDSGITWLYGGINYQIEHHLFPSVSHIHYPRIATVVREYCAEHRTPYVHDPSLKSAFLSSVRTYVWAK